MTTVAVGMSGGVDSSIAVALLKNQGFKVIGLTMKIWGGTYQESNTKCHSCYSPNEEEEIEEAKRVAAILGIEHITVELVDEYKNVVLDYFVQEYESGKTPNPCIKCNSRIKFHSLLEKAKSNGVKFDYFATGHYARVEYSEQYKRYILKQAKDLKKDQSYFLAFLSQKQLSAVLFPLGTYHKAEVKELAASMGLGLESRTESQNFMDGDYSQLIHSYSPGPVLDKNNNVLGQHQGIPFYTIGQRKKLGVSNERPLYVTRLDPERNAIIVGHRDDLLSDELIASNLNWIAFSQLTKPMNIQAKIRYAASKAEAVVTPLNDNSIHVHFKEKQLAITPGQAIVFYDGDIVLGGGIIVNRE